MTWGCLVGFPLAGPDAWVVTPLHCAYKASRHSAVRNVADSKFRIPFFILISSLPASIFRHSLLAPLPCVLLLLIEGVLLGHYFNTPFSTEHSLGCITRHESGLGYIFTALRDLLIFNSPSMPAKKLRCNAKECREAAQRIVGDCTFCNGHFCGKHRLLEDHKCSGLEDVSWLFLNFLSRVLSKSNTWISARSSPMRAMLPSWKPRGHRSSEASKPHPCQPPNSDHPTNHLTSNYRTSYGFSYTSISPTILIHRP